MDNETTPETPAANPTLIDLDELVAQTEMPKGWLRRATKAGMIPGLRVGQQVRYSLAAVQKALVNLASAPAKALGEAHPAAAKKKPASVSLAG
jgi:hypothetical protein